MDREPFNAAMTGDQDAFAQLMRQYVQYISTRIAPQVRYAADVDDLVQETFVAAYTHLAQLQDAGRLAAWLGAIADNQVRMWYRRRYVQLRLETAVELDVADVETDAVMDDLKQAVRRAVGDLSAVQQEAIIYHYFKGYSYAETAALLDIEQDTLRSRLQKARKRLKKEMHTVPDESKDIPARFNLNAQDLSALQWATHFTSDDPQRPVLQGICLDSGGRVVATDGHRLFTRQLAGLKGLTTPVLLGPTAAMKTLPATEAVLTLGNEEVRLAASGQEEQVIPVLEGPYVAYEKVIPPVGPIRVQVEVGALSEALETIAAQLESEHPVDPNGGHTYQPLVEMRLSGTEQTLVLLTTDRMGYSAKEGVGIEGVEGLPSKVAWTFSAAVDIRLEPEDIVFHTKVNHGYLRQIVAALEMSDEEELVLCFIAPDKVIMLTPAERQDAKALLMPCRMEVVAA